MLVAGDSQGIPTLIVSKYEKNIGPLLKLLDGIINCTRVSMANQPQRNDAAIKNHFQQVWIHDGWISRLLDFRFIHKEVCILRRSSNKSTRCTNTDTAHARSAKAIGDKPSDLRRLGCSFHRAILLASRTRSISPFA